MPLLSIVKPNLYKDSVALMRIAAQVLAQAGVRRATLLMGTPGNKELLDHAALLDAGFASAHPSDLMIVVDAETDAACESARDEIARLLDGGPTTERTRHAEVAPPQSLALAVERGANAAVAQISVPGPYAAAEAMKALKQGLHVFLFSDNVPVEQERVLKRLALRKHLLVMGPDCGTAIIGGVPFGFANVVRKGSIGLVGASGTGLQEVSCRIHALGQGVSHVIGTGGRDTHDDVGGITMGEAIDLLAADADTRVIVIVSKPPGAAVTTAILERVQRTGKPFVVLFLGADLSRAARSPRLFPVATLQDAAAAAVAFVETASFESRALDDDAQRAAGEGRSLAPGQRHVHGLYSGGTFCTEAQLVWRGLGMRVESNVPLDAADRLVDVAICRSHCAIDFGAGEFTVGRPHPMIDMSTRIERLAHEARDPAVAVVVLDVVLGYGSHDDPAGALAPAIAQAKAAAAREGRQLSVVAFVCGTEDDPQRLSLQQATLRNAGAQVVEGSTAAARLAGSIAAAAVRTDASGRSRARGL